MTVSLFSNLFVNGLAMGMVYAMLAIGLILLIRAVGILNFAQGDLLMFGAYLTSSLILDVQVPGWLMVPIAMICFMVVGLVFMFGVYWPLRKASYPAATIIDNGRFHHSKGIGYPDLGQCAPIAARHHHRCRKPPRHPASGRCVNSVAVYFDRCHWCCNYCGDPSAL